MEKLLELLEEIDGDIDFRECQTLIDDGELNDHRTEEIKALNIDDMKKVLEALNFEHRTANVIQVPKRK